MVSNTAQTPTVGDHVKVAWGLDVIDGEVVEIYHVGPQTRVRVRIETPDSDEDPETVILSLPMSALTQFWELATQPDR